MAAEQGVRAGADPPAEVGSGRISTGNPVTDGVLGGGFPANTINILMGQPGTGKTIFVEQLLFANAGAERPVLYLTTLSEPLAKVVRFVQDFAFFDESKVGTSVLYDDIGAELAEGGIGVLVPRLQEAIKTLQPCIIVIDSFRALHDLTDSATEIRRLVHDLTGLLTAYETTTFLVGEYDRQDARHRAEFAVADGVVELSRETLGTRDERFFRILKLRGSRYREGSHAFRITRDGVQVYPRLVSPAVPADYASTVDRTPTGTPGLDEMLGGGLLRGSTTLLGGPSGSGKTTLSLQFALEGIRCGERTVYISLQENPTQLARTFRRLAGSAAVPPALELLYASPVELQIDSIIVDLFGRIESGGVSRLVLDAVGDLSVATAEPHRLHDYLYALTQHLAVSGVTSIFTAETAGAAGAMVEITVGPVSYMADNLLLLGMGGEEVTRRTIRVLKTRGSAHDPEVRDIVIDAAGLRLSSP